MTLLYARLISYACFTGCLFQHLPQRGPVILRVMDVSHDSSRFTLIHDLANAFASKLELDELIPFVLARCRELLHASGVSLLLFDSERNELYFPFVSEGDAQAARNLPGIRFPADRGVAGAVLKSARSELIAQAQTDQRFYSAVDRQTGTATGSMLAVPLLSGEMRLGVIEAVRRIGESAFTEQDLSLLETLAASIAVALENAGRFSQMKASAERLRVEVGALRRELARNDRFSEIVAVSPAMAEVFSLMEAAAGSVISVLIEGETGTGKELVARAIHRTSSRADGPFIPINCAAIPEGLLESELFGHRRGAFTGAMVDQQGLVKTASGGVLFLDEIGEMPLAMQAKLLRVLQEGEVTPIGDARPYKVDVRVISATNRNLEAALAAHTFREDLYYRITAFRIALPPLRQRREDIPLMAAHFLKVATKRHGKRIDGFQPEVVEILAHAEWPGNARQLQNEIERAVALARDGESIGPRHLSRAIVQSPGWHAATAAPSPIAVNESSVPAGSNAPGAPSPAKLRPLGDARAAFESSYISGALTQHKGNVSRAAAALGISRVTLQKKMKEYSLR
jgi:Nif-specific regulatory protein